MSIALKPPSSNSSNSFNSFNSSSHAVSRTAELLSCARASLKIARSQNPPPLETDWWVVEPSQLHLHSNNNNAAAYYSPLNDTLEDALSLLRAMQASLETLEGLVRRRGHTNDPTQEIAIKTKQLETDAQELNTIVQQLQATRSRSKQHKKHMEWIASWLQTFATQQSNRLKEVLKVRGTVLADQAQRRKMWNPQAKATTASTARNKKTALESSPLFTMTTPATTTAKRTNGARPPAYVNGRRVANGNSANGTATSGNVANGTAPNGTATNGNASGGGYGGATTTTTPYSSQGGYGGGGYGGYYGGANNNSMGMRQRRNNNNNTNSTAMIQEQVQIRQQQRQTETRAETAKQAERTLAELGTVFGKMSTLIVQQGETLEKLEDDVECALGDVTAGQKEIQTLYSLKKGNRGLIIKVFAVVIFVVLFMRLY